MSNEATDTTASQLNNLQTTPQSVVCVGMFSPGFTRANKLRLCIGYVCLGLTVAATTHAEESSFSHGINSQTQHSEMPALGGSRPGNVPRLAHADDPNNEVLNKISPQVPAHATPDRKAGLYTPSSVGSGEILLSNKNPKAAAMSLKQAILAMNGNTSDYYKKSIK